LGSIEHKELIIMQILRYKRPKIGTVLSTINPLLPYALEDQKNTVLSWSKLVPKVMIIGDVEPLKSDGVRHVKVRPTLNNLIATYAQSMPGLEGVCITNPNVEFDEEGVKQLVEYIASERMELNWGCVSGRTFFMSSQIAAHLVNDLPIGTGFNSEWQPWLDNWMRRLLRQRYLDVSKFNLVKQSIPEAKQETLPPPPPPVKKKSPVRKLKIR
jgi:hypothetical protein